jgi:hypothetical protein
MTYLKSIVAGIAGAFVAVLVSIVAEVAYSATTFAWEASSGSGGIGSVSMGLFGPWTLLAAIAGFGVAFTWERRRAERQRLLH